MRRVLDLAMTHRKTAAALFLFVAVALVAAPAWLQKRPAPVSVSQPGPAEASEAAYLIKRATGCTLAEAVRANNEIVQILKRMIREKGPDASVGMNEHIQVSVAIGEATGCDFDTAAATWILLGQLAE